MAWGISMNESPVVNSEYLPRNALDHMSPFFFKSHVHSHTSSHGHTHAHGYSHQRPRLHQQQHQHNHNHNHIKEDLSPLPLTPPPTSDNQSESSSCDSDLQTPVPRRSSIHAIDAPSRTSYNTPPATPPLTLNENQTAATTAEAATSGTDAATFPSLAWCTARARIPTPDGSEYFLHIYENTVDKKEHLAFVFGDRIRSQSLDRVQPNETEMDRVKRGAYTGRLRATLDTTNMNTITAASTITTTVTTTTSTATTVTLDQHQDAHMETVTDNSPLVRIHSECFTGEIGHSARCDCGEQLDEAIRLMKAEGS
ncbi:GTP cyclohydrolase II, partial [Mortierella polycephala]